MPPEARIPAADIVNDLRNGMSDMQLMKKYGLNSHLLSQVFTELVELKAIRQDEISCRMRHLADEVILENIEHFVLSMRELPRHFVDFPTNVYDVKQPDNQGRLHDINENGVGLRGLETETHDIKTLIITPSDSHLFEPIVFEAECRWVRREEHDGTLASGFRITYISDRELMELRRLVRIVWFGS